MRGLAKEFLVFPLWITLVVIGAYGCNTQLDRSPDKAADSGQEIKDPFSFPKTFEGNLLRTHMDLAVAHGENAEAIYQGSLTKLLEKANVLAPLLYQSYQSMPEYQYMARWLVTETLRELKSVEAIDFLYKIAEAPISEEHWKDDPHRFSQDQEAAIRVTATDGLGLIAQRDNQKAEQLLLKLVKHSDLTVRRTAIRAYLAAGEDYKKRETLMKKILPKESHVLITIKTTDPKTIPYPDIPENFKLREKGRDEAPKINKEGGKIR